MPCHAMPCPPLLTQVQGVNALRQRLLEDRGLEEQLRRVTWVATHDLRGHAGPSGAWVPARAALGPQKFLPGSPAPRLPAVQVSA